MFRVQIDKNIKKNMSSINGFSLIEILAVVVILGLLMTFGIASVSRLISRSKDESKDSHRKTLIMATQSYLQGNKDKMPKDIGESIVVKAQTLRDANYLKEDIYNADKKSCMKDSVVRVYKYDTKDYNYTAHIYCEGDKVPSSIEGIRPEIKITFTDQKGNPYNISKDNVTTAVAKIEIAGGKGSDGENIKLDGYTYIVSAQYDNKDQPVEIYNSGSVNASGKKTIVIEKDITEFLDRSRLSYIIVRVEAYNNDGGKATKTADSRWQDSKKPVCGATTGEPAEDEWNKDWRTKRITIKCSDGDGSGCVKDTFTKTFTKESEYGIITIKDNAGNTTDCKVRVHLDWTKPTLIINAYKRLASGAKGAKVGSTTVTNSSPTLDLNKYLDTFPNSNQVVSNGYGNWLNKAKYPYGIYYEVITEDNVKLGKGTWSENATKLQKNDSKVTTVTAQKSKGTKEFTKGDNKTNFSLVDEGYRYGTYVLKDKALNTVTIRITAPIDRTVPTMPTVKLYKKSSGSNLTSKPNLGEYPNNQWQHTWVYTEASNSSDAISLFDHYEFTTTGKTTKESNVKQSYRNINVEGTSYIKYRACDKAGNCTNYTGNSTIKLDRTAPACNNISRVNSSSGRGYVSKTWLSGNVYTAATCSEGGDVSGCNGVIKLSTSGAVGSRNKHVLNSLIVSQEGTSYTTYYTYDVAGNERACTTVTENIDKTRPSCWTSKSNLYTTAGVTVNVGCSDNLSGVTNCPGTLYGRKSSATYTVYDMAGNSSSCGVTITSYLMYSSRSCASCGSCSSAGCASSSWKKVSTSSPKRSLGSVSCQKEFNYENATSKRSCISGQHSSGSYCDCTDYSKVCKAYNPSCGLCGCASWGGWSGYIYSSCYGSSERQCSSAYFYK